MLVTSTFTGHDVGLTDGDTHTIAMDAQGNIYFDGAPAVLPVIRLVYGKHFIQDELDYLEFKLNEEFGCGQ